MSKWTYVISWRVKGQMRRKEFKTEGDAAAFMVTLEQHGLKPMGRMYRRATWWDKIKARFGIGRIDAVHRG